MKRLLKILIIDDNPADANLLKRHLIKLKLWKPEIYIVFSGDEALKISQQVDANIAFVDYKLGKNNGLDVIQELKKHKTGTAFILLTGYSNEKILTKAIRIGATDYINKKSLNPEILERTIRLATENINAKLQLQRTEQKLARIIDKTETGLTEIDQTGKIYDANNPFVTLIDEKDRKAVLGDWIQNWIPENRNVDFYRFISYCDENGISREFPQILIQQPDGKEKYALINATTETINNEIRIVLLFRDITVRIKTENALRKSEETLKKAQNIAKIGSWEWDLINDSMEWSEQLYRIFGIDKKTFSGDLLSFYQNSVHKDYRELVEKMKERILSSYQTQTLEYQIVLPDGQTKYVKDEGKAELFKQHPIKILRTIQDITGQKQAENSLRDAKLKAEESDRLKTAFLTNLSHEIRTPMNAILGFAELLSDHYYSPEQRREFIDQIHQNGNELLKIINDIIDIAKIETGEIKIHKDKCFVNRVLKKLLREFENERFKANRDELTFRFKPATPEEDFYIYTDKNRFEQIFTNFLSNAVKFTEKGYIEFGYTFNHSYPKQQEKQDVPKNIRFFVKDTGIGLSEDEYRHIFEKFRKIQSKDNNKIYRGTGLGLSIAKKLIEMLDGKIWVDSVVGEGSSFYFTLPFVNSKSYKNSEKRIKNKTNMYNWKEKTLLIAEDVETNYLFMQAALRKTEATLIWAKDGLEAVDFCRENPDIDFVLMDIQMPKLNGYEATKQIKQFRSDLPVVALTAFAMAGEREQSLSAGCDDYISKPIKPKRLLQLISEYI